MSVNLFDANYYRAANADLANFNDQQAASHFQTYGLNEGRAFSPLVNLNWKSIRFWLNHYKFKCRNLFY